MRIKPISDRVVVRTIAAENKTASGIYIPETATSKPQRGVVEAVGSGKGGKEMTVKQGDEVVFGQHSGTEVKIDSQAYLIMREDDIFAILNK